MVLGRVPKFHATGLYRRIPNDLLRQFKRGAGTDYTPPPLPVVHRTSQTVLTDIQIYVIALVYRYVKVRTDVINVIDLTDLLTDTNQC